MNLTTTLLFYALIGSAVGVAAHLSLEASSRAQRWLFTLTAVVFWPFYVPALLQRPTAENARSGEPIGASPPPGAQSAVADELSAAIRQVETELDLALVSLGGWSDAVLAREQHRFQELRGAWRAQADKIRDLDRILNALTPADKSAVDPAPSGERAGQRVAGSLRARQANIGRLAALRDRLHADLMNTLAWVRELVTMIHLAKHTGAPASRAEELVVQIATSIEGLSEVAAWRDADGSMAMEPNGAA